jgi:dTDP-4-dehydrorhamnose reductase
VTATCIVFGANGQMGKACLRALAKLNLNLVPLSKAECNVTNYKALAEAFAAHRPALVINAAALTNVDACETNQAIAHAINAVAPGNIARLCSHHNATLIHLSTDYVFGDNGTAPLDEATKTCPVNYYGQSKLEGEIAIRHETDRHIILRTSWIFSIDANNFFRTMMSLSDRLDTIKVVSDESSCPTFAQELADAIGVMATSCLGPDPIFGTWHACGSEGLNRLSFASAIMDARRRAGVRAATLIPTTQFEFGAAARRPKDSRMSCASLERDFDVAIGSFREHLDESVREILGIKKEFVL